MFGILFDLLLIQSTEILRTQTGNQKCPRNNIIHMMILVPQRTIQRKSQQFPLLVADDGDRISKRIDSLNVAAYLRL